MTTTEVAGNFLEARKEQVSTKCLTEQSVGKFSSLTCKGEVVL